MALPPQSEPPADTPEARRYNSIRRRLGIADIAISFALLLTLLLTGWSNRLRDWAFDAAGSDHYALALFLYVTLLTLAAKLLGLGLDYYGFRLEHRYHLSNQKLRGWAWDEVKGWLVGLALTAIVLELIYLTIRISPAYWWLIAWAVAMVLFVALAQLGPIVLLPLFYKFVPLENEELKQRLLRLSERAGTRVRGVYEWKLSEKSKKANAALAGLGRTRRIILADTLLQNYSDDEIEAVLAHELGHHVHRHIFKSLVVQALVTLAGFWAASAALDYAVEELGIFPHLSDFASIPLLAVVGIALSLLLAPALNAYSRFNERQADRYCFANVADVAPFIAAMNKLGEQNLAERNPSRIVEWLFHSHPAIAKRVAAAEAWKAKRA